MSIPLRTCIGCKKIAGVNELYRWFWYFPADITKLKAHLSAADDVLVPDAMMSSRGYIWTKTRSPLKLPTGWYFIGQIHQNGKCTVSEITALDDLTQDVVEEILKKLEFGIFSPVLYQNSSHQGRGTWLHPNQICLQNAINHQAFQRSLRRHSTVWIDLRQFVTLI